MKEKSVTISLPHDSWVVLETLADQLELSPEMVAEQAVKDMLVSVREQLTIAPQPDKQTLSESRFQKLMGYTLKKNEELYKRLAWGA